MASSFAFCVYRVLSARCDIDEFFPSKGEAYKFWHNKDLDFATGSCIQCWELSVTPDATDICNLIRREVGCWVVTIVDEV